jgi:hypothetical protein
VSSQPLPRQLNFGLQRAAEGGVFELVGDVVGLGEEFGSFLRVGFFELLGEVYVSVRFAVRSLYLIRLLLSLVKNGL